MEHPLRLFGIETEYGLLVEGKDAHDLMEESRLLVRAYAGAHAGPWDYRSEDPRRDMRGFRVDRLNENPADAAYEKPGPPLSIEEQRSDRVLTNGARFYNDHGHPEYATPECTLLRELVAHDRAGERIALACAQARAEAHEANRLALFKNNTDFHGMSYGCHESYLLRRDVPFESVYAALMPFFVTRPIFAGAGKVGVETNGPFGRECLFQISQRADFFTEEASVDTLYRRPILNTRDEPHAEARDYRRLHVICGDANMSEWATAVKVGTTSLVLSLLEAGWRPMFRVRRPVDAIKQVSRDPSLRWLVEMEDGRTIRATDVQRIYCAEAASLMRGASPDADWTLEEWQRILDDLEREPLAADDRLDWVAKRRMLETFIEAEGAWWEDPALRSLDLEYHNIDPETGLYHALEQGGQMRRIVTDEQIALAVASPPATTRASLRGECVRRFAGNVRRIGWNRILLEEAGRGAWIELAALVNAHTPDHLAKMIQQLAGVNTPAAYIALIQGGVDDSAS
jgi:proteasome accessory factor PafA2